MSLAGEGEVQKMGICCAEESSSLAFSNMENGKKLVLLQMPVLFLQSVSYLSGKAKKGSSVGQLEVTPCSVQPTDQCFLEVKGEASPMMTNPGWFSLERTKLTNCKSSSQSILSSLKSKSFPRNLNSTCPSKGHSLWWREGDGREAKAGHCWLVEQVQC